MRALIGLALALALAAPAGAQRPTAAARASSGTPALVEIARESPRAGALARYVAIETEAARVCRTAPCPHPYLALESLSGPKEFWWLNFFDARADYDQAVKAYAAVPGLNAALARAVRDKPPLIVQARDELASLVGDGDPDFAITGARFAVVVEGAAVSALPGGVTYELPGHARVALRLVHERAQAHRLAGRAGPAARVFAIRTDLCLPDPAWRAADPGFWGRR